MFLKKLELKNIRSYRELVIDFKRGITLLAGDIGSGKTTILLSIEFALLGLHSDITGSVLLRHGEQKGEVKLTFEVEGQEYLVCRNLSRASTGIKQEAGYIQTSKGRLDLTARELKAKIIEVLGYPLEIAEKNKDVIYRYTVYTPQEEMKSILFERPEERIEKIRKIFNIDKYKTIKENAVKILRDIKNENKLLQVKLDEEKEIKIKLEEYKTSLKSLKELLVGAVEEKDKVSLEVEKLSKEVEEEQKKQREIQEKLRLKERLESRILSNKEKQKIYENNILSMKKEISEEIKEVKKPVEKNFEEIVRANNEKLVSVRGKKQVALEKIAVCKNLLEASQKNISKFDQLKVCTLCKQSINEEHKSHLEEKESERIKENSSKIEQFTEYLEKAGKIEAKLEEDKKEIEKQKLNHYKETQEYKEYLRTSERKEQKKEEIVELNKNVELLKKETEELLLKSKEIQVKEDNSKYNELLKRKEGIIQRREEVARRESSLNAKIEFTEKIKTELNDKIDRLKLVKKKYLSNEVTVNWIEKHFIYLVDNIEKHVLANVYNEFNERFKAWFEILLEQETMMSELDEDFAPKIIQNGYDTTIYNLSGGEKTATALAYRLALNKTINDFVTDIKTRDIIILDEPTDGFSSDQLDKLRDVLESLNNKQTILVSHEAKLESMAEHIIKVVKEEHDSRTEVW